MAIDAMIDRFRATGCAYAIDGKQGGRLLSPLQQVDYRDFAANPWWDQSELIAACQANIGATGNWELEITFRFFTTDTFNITGYSFNSNWYIRSFDFGASLGGLGVLVFARFISSPSYEILDSSGDFFVNNGGLGIKPSIFPAGEFHTINIKKTDSGAEIYFDGVLKCNVTGTINDNKSNWYSVTNQGNLQSYNIKNSTGTTVWQAPQSELYTGWLLKPLAQDPDGATFEIKQGLIQYGDDTVSSDSAGNLVSSNSTVNYRRIYVPIDLRGYTGNFSLMWQGDCTSGNAIFNQGSGGTSKVTVQLGAATTTDTGFFAMGNGTNSFTIGVNKEIATPGKITFIVSVNRETGEVYVYANGVIAGSGTVSDDFGALNPGANSEYITVRLVDGLSRFAFWNRALSAEEVAAL